MKSSFAIFLFLLASLSIMLAGCPSTSKKPLTFTPPMLPLAEVGKACLMEIVVSNNVTPVSNMYLCKDQLPPGLSLEYKQDNKALITGTPQKKGTFHFSIGASCFGTNVSGQSGVQKYTLVVK